MIPLNMACSHCGGLTMELERILDMQIRVTLIRCLICCREHELGHVPMAKELTGQGKSFNRTGWRAKAKIGEMDA